MNTTNFYNSVFRKISKLNFSLDNCFPFFYFLFFIILINNSGAQQFTVSELPLNDVVARSQLGEIANISYSDNGKMVIQLDIKEEQEIYILEKDSKTITKIECQGNETEPCLNKTDGQYLVFTHTSADGNSNIFLANLSTGQFQQITNATDLENQPVIDENAAIISFTTTPDLKSQKKGIQNIAFYNVSTKEIKQITNKEINSYPSVSGNGSSIIYCSSNPETLKNTIYIYNINAGTSIKVVSNPSSEYLQPKLNHDASKALYVEQGTGGGKTFIIELAINIRKAIKQSELNFPCFGKNDSTITYFNTDEGFIHVKNENPFTNVKNDVGIYFKPFFELASEDFKETRTVRFEKLLKYGGIQSIDVAINNTLIMTCNDTLYLYKTGEERATQLSLDNEEIDDIKISEDGQKIVFASKRKGEEDIICIDLAGKKRINITPNTDVRDYDPEIDSKGELVSYTSDRDGNENIYAVNIITLEKKQITNSVNDEWDSHPLPDGSAIVYLFKSKEKHMICMKEMKEGAQEKIVQKSLTLKYDQLDVSDKGIAYIRSTGSSHAIDYYIFDAEKPITFPGAKGVNCFPQINETEYLSWVTINPDKSVSINITKTTGLPKDYKTVTLYGAEFLSSDREIIHKVSKDGKNIYTFVKEDKNLIFKKINNPYIE